MVVGTALRNWPQRKNMAYKYQRARTSRVGPVHENQDALRLPRGRLGRAATPSSSTSLASMITPWPLPPIGLRSRTGQNTRSRYGEELVGGRARGSSVGSAAGLIEVRPVDAAPP